MITLNIDNSESKLVGLSLNQHKELKEVLSYNLAPKMNFFTKTYHSNKKSLLDRRGVFPTGLLNYVETYFKSNTIGYNRVDNRVCPINANKLFTLNLPYLPYPEQEEIVKSCIRKHRGTVEAVTGFGKSVTMAILVNALQLKTLIVVPNLNLKEQLKASFKEYFGNLDNITIENIDSASLKKDNKYDLLIIDEAHHVGAETYRKLNKTVWKSIYYRFYFTATPFRSREEEQILFESVAGQLIHRIGYHEAVQKSYITPIEAYYYELPKTRFNSNSWPEVYNALVVNNRDRNHLIARLITSLRDSGISVLCLVKEIKHGFILSELSKTHFANGVNEDTPDLIKFFNERKIKGLIGTTGIIGEGMDTRPAEFIIIAGLGKSRNALIQQFGRGIRKYPAKDTCKIIIFLDKSHKYTVNHFKDQIKILEKEYGVKTVKLDLPSE